MSDDVLDWLDGRASNQSRSFAPQSDDDIMAWMDGLQTVQEGAAGARRAPAPYVQNAPRLPGEGTRAPARRAQPPPKAPTPDVPDVSTTKLGQTRGDARSWLKDYIEGKTDPKYANTQGFNEGDLGSSANPEADASSMQWSKMLAGGDEAYGNMLKRQLGSAFVRFEEDQYGQKLIVFRDGQGNEQTRYVNKPGLDWQDVDRAVTGTLPYLVTGTMAGAATRTASPLLQFLAQGGAAGATRYSSDALGNLFMGANTPVDFGQVGLMGLVGGAGGLLARPTGALNRKMLIEPSIYDRSSGKLTEKGAALAQKAGVDPAAMEAQIAEEFAKTYAKTGSAAEAGTRATTTEFGIPVTKGQLTKDPQSLLVEKNMRSHLYGDQSFNVMREFDAGQTQAIHNAALGLDRSGASPQGIAPMLNPGRALMDAGTDTLGPSIRQGLADARGAASKQESAAWKNIPDLYADKTGFDAIPDVIGNRLRLANMEVDDVTMPQSARMGDMLKDYIAGKNQASRNADVFGAKTPTNQVDVDSMRRRLLGRYQDAAPGSTDARAAKAIYNGFNDWILKAADEKMVSVASGAAQSGTEHAASIQAAAALRTARDTTKDIRNVFEPTTRKGKPTPASNIIDKVMDESNGLSAEGVVQTLFGAYAKTGAPKEGTVQALTQIKAGLDKFGGEGGKQTWNDIRLAYWMRIVQDKQGNIYTPQVMLNNIQNAMHSHGDVARLLYSGQELSTMNRFAQALRNVAYKDPNPSGTGTAVALSTKEFATTMMRAIGWQTNGPLGLLLATAMKPLRNMMGSVGAQQLTKQGASRVIDPVLAPYLTGPTQAIARTDLGGPE